MRTAHAPHLQELERRLLLAAGELDATFAGGLIAQDILGPGDWGFALAVQSDGKTLLAGRAAGAGGDDFAVVRFNADGTLDSSFSGGIVVIDLGSPYDSAYAIAVQPDGKIILAGESFRSGQSANFALFRLNPDGTSDASFGNGGLVITDFAGGPDQAKSVALSSDGRIVVSGSAYIGGAMQFALARYMPDGQLDATFGVAGKSVAVFSQGSSGANSLALSSDGSILAAGYAYDYGTQTSDWALARYQASGTIDAAFGANGWVVVDMGGNAESAFAAIVQSDGRIILAGDNYDGDSGQSDFAAVRLTGDGQLDTTFGVGGKAYVDFAGEADQAFSAAVQSDGKPVLAGLATVGGNTMIAMARLDIAGALDSTFAGGRVTLSLGAASAANSVAIDPSGRLVVGGFTMNQAGETDFAAARLLTTQPQPPPPPQPSDDQAVSLLDDPNVSGRKILRVQATAGADRLVFRSVRRGVIEVRLNGKKLGRFSGISRIIAVGNEGDDLIDARCAGAPAELLGGSGNDLLLGSRFGDILVGGDGDDRLFGYRGNDLLIGGTGRDRLWGLFGDDVLIGGSLSYENDLNALRSVPGGQPDPTSVIDDGARDDLFGTAGADTLLAGATDKLHLTRHFRR